MGIRDIPAAIFAPRRLFARVEDVAAWGWPLLILLTFVTLIGYATVECGLIDQEINRRVRERIKQIDSAQRDVVERSALRDLYEQEIKMGEFQKLLTRIRVIAAEPAKALAAALLIAAVLYGVVALTGRKPEWHTLLTICVFAGFIDALRLLLTLVLMLSYGTLEVSTSLTLLTRLFVEEGSLTPENVTNLAALSGLLTALDPFRIWYWLVVIVGLSVTRQLRGWRAWGICILCWLSGTGGRTALTVVSVTGMASGGGATNG
ncbi:MAG: YIP1 family protein [Phycisphaerae bacterium]|nr:YIP1 family protein [Phycisphaerae bacterium]